MIAACLQAFPDDACLLIANNDKKLNATNVTVTMIQYFDRPRCVAIRCTT